MKQMSTIPFDDYYNLCDLSYTGKIQEIEDLLMKLGVDVNARDEDKHMTFLMHAVVGGQYETCTRLLELGANINAQDMDGQTVLHHFLDNINMDDDHKKAGEKPKWELFQMLLDHGADTEIVNSGNYTPLYIAVQKSYMEGCQMLLDKGADPNIRDRMDWTPLHYASANNNYDLCVLLVDYGADVSATNCTGKKIYDMHYSSNHHIYDYLTQVERERQELRMVFKRAQLETEDDSDEEDV